MALTAAQLLVKIGADTSDAEQGMSRVSRSLQSFGADAMKAGGVLSAAVTAPLALMGKSAVQAATDLDREMRNIQSISKQTDTEIAALSDTFVRMSMDASITTDSAVKLAAGFYDIQGSGFAGAAAMQVLEASTKAASAGLTDTDVAAKAITATLNAYGYGADQATRVSDVLFKTMDIGVVTFDELAQNLGDIVGTAAIAGVSIEELGAAYATMTKAGIGAAESSTALNQLMLSFISPSKQAAEMAATLGIDLSAAALQSKGLGGAMADLTERVGLHKIVMTGADEATKAQIKSIDQQVRALQAQKDALGPATKANKEQRDAIQAQIKALQRQKAELRDSIDTNVDYNLVLTTMAERAGVTVEQMSALFPNVRALKAALSLTRGEMGPFAEDLETIAGASGATEAAFAIQAKSFAAQMKTFSSTLEGLKISIGQIVLPILTELMNQVKPLLERFMNLDDGTKRIIVTLGVLAAAAGPVIMALGAVSMVVGALASPVGLVIAAVAALGAAWTMNLGGIQEQTQAVLDWISPYVQTVMVAVQGAFSVAITFISGIVQSGLEFVRAFWEESGADIMTIVGFMWDNVQSAFNTAVAVIQAIVGVATAVIQRLWEDHGATVIALLQNAWDSIQAIFQIAMGIIQGIIKAVASAIRGDWEGFGQALRGIVDNTWEQIQRIFANSVADITLIVSDFIKTVIRFFTETDWGAVGRGIIEGIASGIRNAAGFLADAARDAARAALDAAKGFLGISSPSRVAAEMIGKPFVEGIGLGIDQAIGKLTGQHITNLSARMVAPAGGAGYGSSIDYERLGTTVATAMRQHPTYQISANYRYQDERSLRDDLRLLQMLGAAT